MPLFLDTQGESVLGIGICARCSRKMPLLDLQPDRNSPGLMVCKEDNDQLDPYRLPPRQPDNLVLPFYRPDLPLTIPTFADFLKIISSEIPEGLETELEIALTTEDFNYYPVLERLLGYYFGKINIFTLGVEIIDPNLEVNLTWPSDVGFEPLEYDLYAFYDIAHPTAQDFRLIATIPVGTLSYNDAHGYLTNFGYMMIVKGIDSELAYSPGLIGPPV